MSHEIILFHQNVQKLIGNTRNSLTTAIKFSLFSSFKSGTSTASILITVSRHSMTEMKFATSKHHRINTKDAQWFESKNE